MIEVSTIDKNETEEEFKLAIKCQVCNQLSIKNDKRHPYCSLECLAKMKKCLCNTCDSIFYSTRGKNKYCSEECKQVQCVGCNNIFTWTQSPQQKYCTKRCRTKHLTRDCKFCGVSFEASSVGVEYCGKDCRVAHKSFLRGYKICKQCKNPISYIKDFFAPNFCDDSCRDKYTEEKHGDKIKHSKQPIVSEVEDIVAFRVKSLLQRKKDFISRLKQGLDYNLLDSFTDTIRQTILERDQHSCYICEDDRELEVHHILPRKFGGNHDDDNLVALCVKCHRAVETGNVEHAVSRCVERAKKNLGLSKEKHEIRMSKIDFLASMKEELNGLFESINDEQPKEEVLINIDELLYAIDEWKATKY